MNYRHAFHAGNFADVAKHVTLIGLLQALSRKPAAWRCIETHAGAGRYALRAGPGRRAEHLEGIGRLWTAPLEDSLLADYRALVAAHNTDGRLVHYPGSPLLAAALARAGDRLVFCESEPAVARSLHQALAGDRRCRVMQTDGPAALKGLLPPPERRGLVLIDPPYEAREEWRTAAAALQAAWRRWPTGIYALWYPLKDPGLVQGLYRRLAACGIPRILRSECRQFPSDAPPGLHGGGVLIVNPPHTLPARLATALTCLCRLLAPRGGARVDWLVPEAPARR